MSFHNGHPQGLSKSTMGNFDSTRYPGSAPGERNMGPQPVGLQDARMGGRGFDLERYAAPAPRGFDAPPNMLDLEQRMHEHRVHEQQRLGGDAPSRGPFPPHLPFAPLPGSLHAPSPLALGGALYGRPSLPQQNPFFAQHARPPSVTEVVHVPQELAMFVSEPKFAQILLRVKEQTIANFITVKRAEDGHGEVESVVIDAASKSAAELAKNLIETHLKLQMKIKAAENRLQKVQTEFFSTQGDIAAGNVIEFSIHPELLGLTIGKKGLRIKQIETDTGVSSINVADSGKITIYGPDAQSVQNAKDQLELFEDAFPLTERQVQWLADKYNMSTLVDLRTTSGLMVAKLNREAATLDVVGTAAATQMARCLWSTQQEYLDREMELKDSERETIERLYAVRKQYGLPRGQNGGQRYDRDNRDNRDNKDGRDGKDQRAHRERDGKSASVSSSLFDNLNSALHAPRARPAQEREKERQRDPLDALIDDNKAPRDARDAHKSRDNKRRDVQPERPVDAQAAKQPQQSQSRGNKAKDDKPKETAAPAAAAASAAPPGLASKKKGAKDKEKDKEPMLVKINTPFLAEQTTRTQGQGAAKAEKSKAKPAKAKDEVAVAAKPVSIPIVPPTPPPGPPAVESAVHSLIVTPPSPPADKPADVARKNKGRDKQQRDKEKEKEKESEKAQVAAPAAADSNKAKDKSRRERGKKNAGEPDADEKEKEQGARAEAPATDPSK